MRILLLMIACAVVLLENVATAEEINIKRGNFPYMAFIYYADQTVLDGSGEKFTRSAVLIKQNWLISASIESENTPIAFPEKTLVARLGAISIDSKFNFNEDEGEQEREIIQIARPYDFNNTEWWYNDISLLKTLLPFNITNAVTTFEIISKKLNTEESCFMLVYAKPNQIAVNERILTKISVELIASSQDKCGSNFSNDSMICATARNEINKINPDSNFCMGNSGGPLICGNKLIGTQTYVDNCNQPYLYQLLTSWDDLITCAMEEKCQEEQCAKICFTTNKDPTTVTTLKTTATEEWKIKEVSEYINETTIGTTIISPTITTLKEISETATAKTTLNTITEKEDETKATKTTKLTSVSTLSTVEETSSESSENTEREMTDFTEEQERKTHVEAKQLTTRNGAPINMSFTFKYSIYFLCMYLSLHLLI